MRKRIQFYFQIKSPKEQKLGLLSYVKTMLRIRDFYIAIKAAPIAFIVLFIIFFKYEKSMIEALLDTFYFFPVLILVYLFVAFFEHYHSWTRSTLVEDEVVSFGRTKLSIRDYSRFHIFNENYLILVGKVQIDRKVPLAQNVYLYISDSVMVLKIKSHFAEIGLNDHGYTQ